MTMKELKQLNVNLKELNRAIQDALEWRTERRRQGGGSVAKATRKEVVSRATSE